jgi:toxin ParE1/3/4
MLNLIWRETARQDVRDIVTFIAEQNVHAALDLKARIEAAAERLIHHPYMFRTGRMPGTREALVHPNYVLVYCVGADAVEVVGVFHSRRQYPPESGQAAG